MSGPVERMALMLFPSYSFYIKNEKAIMVYYYPFPNTKTVVVEEDQVIWTAHLYWFEVIAIIVIQSYK